ncbi:hypothetical protein AB0F52_41050 [Amycolatopsis sp. NPDC024027]|uniref:hypothetical protein n=1 Tax=Amycolatopsis sp. NPDC024027 TaxID=3154327 RepID=UPI0033D41DEB
MENRRDADRLRPVLPRLTAPWTGGSLPRTRGFGLSADGGTVVVLFTGTDFPEVPLPGLGLAILSGLDAFARDLGVRR